MTDNSRRTTPAGDPRATDASATGITSGPIPELQRPAPVDLRGVRVLVTNDDGIDSPGILALAHAAQRSGAEVIVVAPVDNRSGAAAAIGPIGRRLTRPNDPQQWAGIETHTIDAPPAAAVLAACSGEGFGAPPVAVLSGVNHGLNLGRVVLHSGTVGAALTAASMGIPGVAASLEPGNEETWEIAAHHATDLLSRLCRAGRPPMALNLNVPANPRRRYPVAATLSRGGRTRAATNDGTFTFELEVRTDADAEPGSDAALVAEGFATFTALAPLATPPADSWTHLVPLDDDVPQGAARQH
jgi:5'-nucleotidase